MIIQLRNNWILLEFIYKHTVSYVLYPKYNNVKNFNEIMKFNLHIV